MEHNRRENGQSIIVIAFIVMVILALLALVVDIGNAYAQRRVVQNAVDASAMACAAKLATQGPLGDNGVRENAVRDVDVEEVMRDYAEFNGMDRNEVEGMYVRADGSAIRAVGSDIYGYAPSDARGVQVNGDLTFATYFAHLLGVEEITVNAPGAAYVLTAPCSSDELFPTAVNVDNFPNGVPELNTPYVMMGGNPSVPDEFWWVHWDPRGSDANYKQGTSSQALDWNIADTTRSGTWRVDNWVQESSGTQMDSGTRCLLEGRINNDGTTAHDCDSKMPNITLIPTVTIPIFDVYSAACPEPGMPDDPETCGQPGNTKAYHIIGFAEFEITCYYHSNTKWAGDCGDCAAATDKDSHCLSGEFVRWVDEPFDDNCSGLDTGITAPSYRMPTQP